MIFHAVQSLPSRRLSWHTKPERSPRRSGANKRSITSLGSYFVNEAGEKRELAQMDQELLDRPSPPYWMVRDFRHRLKQRLTGRLHSNRIHGAVRSCAR